MSWMWSACGFLIGASKSMTSTFLSKLSGPISSASGPNSPSVGGCLDMARAEVWPLPANEHELSQKTTLKGRENYPWASFWVGHLNLTWLRQWGSQGQHPCVFYVGLHGRCAVAAWPLDLVDEKKAPGQLHCQCMWPRPRVWLCVLGLRLFRFIIGNAVVHLVIETGLNNQPGEWKIYETLKFPLNIPLVSAGMCHMGTATKATALGLGPAQLQASMNPSQAWPGQAYEGLAAGACWLSGQTGRSPLLICLVRDLRCPLRHSGLMGLIGHLGWLGGGSDGPGMSVFTCLCFLWPDLSPASSLVSSYGLCCLLCHSCCLISHHIQHLCHCSSATNHPRCLSTPLVHPNGLLAWPLDTAHSFSMVP